MTCDEFSKFAVSLLGQDASQNAQRTIELHSVLVTSLAAAGAESLRTKMNEAGVALGEAAQEQEAARVKWKEEMRVSLAQSEAAAEARVEAVMLQAEVCWALR